MANIRPDYTAASPPTQPGQAYDVTSLCDKLRISMYRLAVFARRGVAVSVLVVAVVVGGVLLAGATPEAHADEPEITFQYPKDGDVFLEPLLVIQVCFAEPIDVRDLPPQGEGEFKFDMDRPDGLGVGMRIVFQPNGYGATIYPGLVDENREGLWGLTFQIRDRESLDTLNHTISWQVESGGASVITPTPAVCPTTGEPPMTPIDDPDTTPVATDEPGGEGDLDEGSDVDVLELALLTVGAAGGAGVLLLIGYVIRRRVGFWLHRPPDDDESSDDQH